MLAVSIEIKYVIGRSGARANRARRAGNVRLSDIQLLNNQIFDLNLIFTMDSVDHGV